jgi:CDP-diacylglycerol--glycerol-3-phosphate 3-phosphatidyltransferase
MRNELAVLAGALTFVLISMVVYRLSVSGGRTSSDLTGRGGSFFLGFWVRNWFYWFIGPIIRFSIARGLSPLFYNLLAVVFGLASLLAFASGHLPTAGWMILFSGFADVMDGEVARGRNVVSKSGAFLDSTLDRFSEFAAFIGLAWYFGSGLPALLVLIALGGSLLVSYTRARGESLGVLCKTGWMQRAERMILMGLGAILDPVVSDAFGRDIGFLMTILTGVIAAGTVATAIYRTVWISRALEEQ